MTLKLYTRTVCPQCLWVKSEINEKGLTVEEINMDEDPAAKDFIVEQGYSAAPILEVDGELITGVPTIIAKLDEIAS